MNTDKVVRESKTIMLVTLVIGVALLATGIIFKLLEINLLPNNMAIIGLSLIPLSVALAYYVKLLGIKKSPQKFIINEIDERLVALKNEADAKAFKIVQGALFLTYMGYTLMIPKDVFETVGWWLLMILLLISFISQAILTMNVMIKENSKDKEEE
ncbi:hypothetical protein E4K67_13060 [Desulfosporosinus fructosivorans]|uniref:Uncharacterized protein n=1 Tax=Desulfosporosinus fructosivorans TaxID=2018669 RepID=A0A4Z0R7T1_9FIRM|nr:hypothetical protein [Desulfosporosinus fructosivorans]TGE37656.1 hypothetical protein E4K67_13060 [Desulfosporosinus fructosivorans]